MTKAEAARQPQPWRTHEAGHEADEEAEQDSDGVGDEPDEERRAPGVQQPAQVVAPELIGAEGNIGLGGADSSPTGISLRN